MMSQKRLRKIEEKFGVTSEQLEQWEAEAARGELPGKPVGEVVVGRPLKFGKPLKLVGFREAPDEVAAMDRRAADLGMSRSDYLRHLVRQDLAAAS